MSDTWKLKVTDNIFTIGANKTIDSASNALLWQDDTGHCGPLLGPGKGLIVLEGTY